MFTPWGGRLSGASGSRLLGLTVLWRVVGGAGTGAALYVLLPDGALRRDGPADRMGHSACTIVCLADAGFMDGRTVARRHSA